MSSPDAPPLFTRASADQLSRPACLHHVPDLSFDDLARGVRRVHVDFDNEKLGLRLQASSLQWVPATVIKVCHCPPRIRRPARTRRASDAAAAVASCAVAASSAPPRRPCTVLADLAGAMRMS